MDQLPEEENPEERQTGEFHGSRMGRPADEGRHGAGDRPNGGRQRRPELHGRVDGVVEHCRDEGQQGRGPPQPEPQMGDARHQQEPAERPHVIGRQASGGDGARSGANHESVRNPLDVLVQGQGARRGEAHAEADMEQAGPPDGRRRGHQISGGRGHHDEHRDTRLGQLQIRGGEAAAGRRDRCR